MVTAGSVRSSVPARSARDHGSRQRFHIDLESDAERRRRIDGGKDLVHAKHGRPELLVAEGVVTEDGAPFARVRAVRLCRDVGSGGESGEDTGENERVCERADMDQSHRLLLSMRVITR